MYGMPAVFESVAWIGRGHCLESLFPEQMFGTVSTDIYQLYMRSRFPTLV
jgi:hypothetical protein